MRSATRGSTTRTCTGGASPAWRRRWVRWPGGTREVGELAGTCKRSTTINLGDVESESRARVAATLDEALSLSNEHYSGDVRTPGLAIGLQRDLLARKGWWRQICLRRGVSALRQCSR